MRLSIAVVVAFAVGVACNGLIGAHAIRSYSSEDSRARGNNAVDKSPLQKVILLLQAMAQKVSEEGDKEKDIFLEFMCYCKAGQADLEKSISDNEAKVPTAQSDIESAQSQKAKLQEELKMHTAYREAAKKAMAEATAVREKEKRVYDAESTETKEYITSLEKAVSAITSGMAGRAFLQTNSAVAASVRRATSADPGITDDDRDAVLAFMSIGSNSNAEYMPTSGEIVGILKTIKADYEKNIAKVNTVEAEAVKLFEDLLAAKTKEVRTLSSAIEKKTARVGVLSVDIVNMKHELTDAEAMLIADRKFLENLSGDCKGKQAKWDERQQLRSEELKAIHDTIKILSNDDARDLFRKTLPGSASMLQIGQRKDAAARDAAAHLQRMSKWPRVVGDRPEVRFLEMALLGKKVDFSKVTKMVDHIVALLEEEQADDDQKSEYCKSQESLAADKAKDISKSIQEAKTIIAEHEETLAALADDISLVEKEVMELDRLVADASAERKAQHQEFLELMTSKKAAEELLEFAQNRLKKFYSPSSEVASSFAQRRVTSLLQKASSHRVHPGPPPAFLSTSYSNMGENNKVIGMIAVLIGDLTKEMAVAQKDEEIAQRDYEAIMEDSADKRATCIKSLNVKKSSQAEYEEMRTQEDGYLAGSTKELEAVESFKARLHNECDWLLQNFSLRKTARADEIDNLKKAKAVLLGADYSLVQAVGNKQRVPLLSRARHA